jgi:predicted nucleic acid-binding protein
VTPVLVDSNVLLDVITSDPTWGEWSAAALERAADATVLVVNALVYAEVSIGFERFEDVEQLFAPDAFRRENLPWESAFLSGKCFHAYRRRGGSRRSPLPDIYNGAHAAVRGYRLLTRDARRYRTYFPKLGLIAPDPS